MFLHGSVALWRHKYLALPSIFLVQNTPAMWLLSLPSAQSARRLTTMVLAYLTAVCIGICCTSLCVLGSADSRVHKTVMNNFDMLISCTVEVLTLLIERSLISLYNMYNIALQHPVALRRSDFAFSFLAVYVQRRLLFSCRFLLISTRCFGLVSHLQVYTEAKHKVR
jgi:hypothetical protein